MGQANYIKGDTTSEGRIIEAESEKLCNTLLKRASFEGEPFATVCLRHRPSGSGKPK